MCGIFGALGALPPDALDQVSQALAHRGPDEDGRWSDGRATLLHRRLSIIDLSPAGRQPLSNEDQSVWLVFNGEIYNHRALRAQLEAHGHAFRSRTDSEVIVHGYEQWGDAVVERLDGMFALGLWDARAGRLLLARDRAGKKPLFHTTEGPFRFGSSIAALHSAGVPAALAVETLPEYLTFGYVATPATMHRGVAQLPPATRMIVTPAGAGAPETYWRPRFGVELVRAPFEEASREVRRLVTAAVERRLESDVPLGAFLSGGIDSTIVVGVMAHALGPRVRTFSIGFSGDPRYDETRYARLASRAFGTEHTEFTLDPTSFDLVKTLVRHHDGPFGDSSAIPTYTVARLTRQHVKVALTGDGGDELFCGYERFLAAELAERIPRPARALAVRVGDLLPGAVSAKSRVDRARRFLRASALPLGDRLARWNSFFAEPGELLRPELAATLDLEAPLQPQRRLFALCQSRHPLARALEHNFRTYLPFDLLVKADRCSMAHGLEARSPFLDTALIEYAARLPPAYLRRGLETKRILRHGFRDLLPPEIATRGKMGFGVPLGAWFRGDLRDYLHDHLGPGARLLELLAPAPIARLLEEHARGARDHGQRLWALLTLEVWLRTLAEPARARAASSGAVTHGPA